VDGVNISDKYNIQSGKTQTLNRDNVVNNPVINPEKIDRQKVVLYFTDSDKKELFPEERSIEIKQSQTAEYQIVEQLMSGPVDSSLKGCMPQGAKIKDIKTEDGICYVNLTSEFVNNIGNGGDTEKLAIYSIVNSLTELNNVNKVQFLIEGEKISNYKGSYDFSKTFERDESLIGK
jgi:germination protein M